MPFIHRFLTPREERNMVYKTFSAAVMKQYPNEFDSIMGQIWKMPYEKLLRASLTTHHVNIYVDLAASKITGVSQYDRYVKHVRRLSRVIGEIEDTPFLDLPRTDDVLMDHLFMKVCEFCPAPHQQLAEAVTQELYDQGYIENRGDIVDMLEQPLLLQKRVRHICKQINTATGATLFPDMDKLSCNSSLHRDSFSLTEGAPIGQVAFSAPATAEGSEDSSRRNSASAIFTNNFDQLFEQAAVASRISNSANHSSSSVDYSAAGVAPFPRVLSPSRSRNYSAQVEALHLEVVNETSSQKQQSPDEPSKVDLMEFSPGPRIKIVVESGDPDFEPLLGKDSSLAVQRRLKGDRKESESDENLSSCVNRTESRTRSGSSAVEVGGKKQLVEKLTKQNRTEAALMSKSGESVVQKRGHRRQKKRNGRDEKERNEGGFVDTGEKEESCNQDCDLCVYERRYSQQLSEMNIDDVTQQFSKLKEYLQSTGDRLPSKIDLPPECDLSILLDPGELESDPEDNLVADILMSAHVQTAEKTGQSSKEGLEGDDELLPDTSTAADVPLVLSAPPSKSQVRKKSRDKQAVAECC